MRNRKHGGKNGKRPARRKKRVMKIGLALAMLMAASVIGAAYTNRATNPTEYKRQTAQANQAAKTGSGEEKPAAH